MRKYTYQENINIDLTPEFAYSLGFIWGDGHVVKKLNEIRIEIVSKDAHQIIKILKKIGRWTFYERTRKNRQPQTTIRTSDIKFKKFLEKYNYTTKSSDCTIFYELSDDLKKYFLLGLLDADGCIDKDRNHVSFSAPYEQDWKFLEIYLKNNNIEYKITKHVSNTNSKHSFIRMIGYKNVIKFLDLLYHNNPILSLSRKKEKYLFIKERWKKSINNPSNNPKIKNLKYKFISF